MKLNQKPFTLCLGEIFLTLRKSIKIKQSFRLCVKSKSKPNSEFELNSFLNANRISFIFYETGFRKFRIFLSLYIFLNKTRFSQNYLIIFSSTYFMVIQSKQFLQALAFFLAYNTLYYFILCHIEFFLSITAYRYIFSIFNTSCVLKIYLLVYSFCYFPIGYQIL